MTDIMLFVATSSCKNYAIAKRIPALSHLLDIEPDFNKKVAYFQRGMQLQGLTS
jgi:hypothetical protein